MTMGRYFALGLIGLLVFGSISPIWATSDLTVNLSPEGTPAPSTFKFLESAFIEYPNGGKLKDLLAGKTYTISFTENSNNTSVQDLIHQLNTALTRDQKSPVIITDLTVEYTATIVGDDKSASIDYNLQLTPTLTSYVITKGSGNDPTIIDAVWMGLTLKGPVIIKTAQYSDVEINTPISFVKKATPDVYAIIQGSTAEDALKNNLIDASSILQEPLDQWNHLFDPAFIISETSGFGYKGQKVAITTYTMGQSSLSEGIQKPTQNEVDFSADTNYKLTTIQHASSASVNIEGHAITTSVGGTPAFGTTPESTGGDTSSGGFPVGIIYGMAIFGAVVAGGVLFWSNKKLKDSANRPKDTGPARTLEYEERKHWADKFDKKSAT
ncbi:MAG: hypothetical protein HY222_01810 [Thaumarchaeota archaeon]|nr:hypothetical protein [Nitrososphaerota archaeon]MBI3641109.1 hypothetical protein [Nitrososphaerota archaeon]